VAPAAKPNAFEMRIGLLGFRPKIWRRVLVPGSVRLNKLHLIFQDVMGWTNSHLHAFRTATRCMGCRVAVCLEGANSCPPEDVGGTGGYEELLEVLADPAREEHRHYVSWAGRNFDPKRFDLAQVNAALQYLG
jgi:hypothetical protein